NTPPTEFYTLSLHDALPICINGKYMYRPIDRDPSTVAGVITCWAAASTARGESPAAFGRRCIPADCVAPRSNIPDILGRRALSRSEEHTSELQSRFDLVCRL